MNSHWAMIHNRSHTELRAYQSVYQGVPLTDRKPSVDWAEDTIVLELPEDLVLPHEVTEPGYEPRTFYVPARILNKWLDHQGQADGGTIATST